jgi:hypothetical protein
LQQKRKGYIWQEPGFVQKAAIFEKIDALF